MGVNLIDRCIWQAGHAGARGGARGVERARAQQLRRAARAAPRRALPCPRAPRARALRRQGTGEGYHLQLA